MADNTSQTFVIVGASVAGARAAEALRSEGFDGRIVLVGEEAELPYERPPLSKGVLLGNDEPSAVYLHEQGWYDEQRIELRLGARALLIDRDAHEVELSDGSRLSYDKLLLATGSSVRRPKIPGGDLDGVLYLRTLADSNRLRAAFAADRRVVVVGAGWIGLETAAAAHAAGAAVTVIEPQPTPLFAALGREMGEVFADLHRENGVDLRLGQSVTAFRGDGPGGATVTAVVTGDGEEVPADVVVVGVGVTPNTELAESAGLDVAHGVVTDARLQTSDPDIFAAGDVVRWQSPVFGRTLRVEHWANAHDGGPAAARSMLGSDAVYDAIPFFFSDQYDLGMEYAGDVGPDGYDEVVVRGDARAREFVAFWLRGGRVVAGMNVNVWDVQDDIQALIRSGSVVDRARLADPQVPLGDLTS
ncbi:FAD-dependent oxidoreductase [Actinopolymorpha sp. B9G3]|uniref:NAD(P)/FAD-dependent oxidoreductase n=1 Tax=Actinopolymorpha sp. B9G3 TaxID=3158970 RepID=UPI0032D98823